MSSVGTRIAGAGHAIPSGRLTNSDLAARFGLNAEDIFERTGIQSRAIASESLVELSLTASQMALSEAGVTSNQLDFILFATMKPERVIPATANLLQARLGNSNCYCVDLNAACSGFKFSLTIADALIRSGGYRTGLVVGADLSHQLTDPNVYGPVLLFGDAAGAFVLQASSNNSRFLAHFDKTRSEFVEDLTIPPGEAYMKMNGQRVFIEAVTGMCDIVIELCQKTGVNVSDIDHIVPHQANVRILESVADRLGIPREKFVIDMRDIGNTSSASIPVAFSRAQHSGRIKNGELVLFLTFAAGFSGGASLVRV